jgi:hypothetical protein
MERAIVDPAPRDFGSIISKHSLRKEYRSFCVLLTTIGLSTAFISAAIGIYRWYFAYRHFGPAAVARWSGPAIGLSIVSTLLGLIGLACLLHLRGSYAKVCSGGILIGRRGKTEKIPWDQINAISMASVRYGLLWFTWGSSSRITFHLKPNGKRTLSQSLANLDQLAISAKKYVYPGLLEQYRNSLQQGDAVQFGSIEIKRDGLVHGKRHIPWAEINEVTLARGFLRIHTRSSRWKRSIRLSAQRIPNIDLCFQLMQHFIGEQKSKQQGS